LTDLGYEVIRILGFEVLRDPAGVRNRIEDAIDRRFKSCGPRAPGES
jgi:very-short-patch-repair endonuclease